ncbi:Do family serine endopeptidase [Calditrichota bacterium]
MRTKDSSAHRLLYTFIFGFICVAAGFMLATGWELPTKSTAQSFSQPAATTALNAAIPLVNLDGESPFIAVAEAVKPVVVNISAEKTLTNHPSVPFDLFDFGPFFGDPPRDPQNNPRRQPHVTSGGSGIIVDAEGYILTNNHVVSDATEIRVKLTNGEEYDAQVVGKDPETDVALIKIDHMLDPSMVAALGNSDDIRIGQWAIAVGNPFGLDWTVTVGVISARGRSNLRIGGGEGPSYQNFIQTDASINFGNSGGPLVNIHGEVVGVNTAINAQGQGIGFAIPINLARKVMDQLKRSGVVERGYLGIYPSELTEIKREALGVPENQAGVFVEGVQEKTPADKGGLKGGDIITAIEGNPVNDVQDFRFRIADYPPDSKVRMTVLQDGKSRNMEFKLGNRNEYVNRDEQPAMKREHIWLGMEVTTTDSREGRSLGVEETDGVLILRIEPDSPAEGLMEPGDVIVEIAGEEVHDMKDYTRIAESLKDRKKAIPFWVMRSGRRMFIPVRPVE